MKIKKTKLPALFRKTKAFAKVVPREQRADALIQLAIEWSRTKKDKHDGARALGLLAWAFYRYRNFQSGRYVPIRGFE